MTLEALAQIFLVDPRHWVGSKGGLQVPSMEGGIGTVAGAGLVVARVSPSIVRAISLSAISDCKALIATESRYNSLCSAENVSVSSAADSRSVASNRSRAISDPSRVR